mmetsp:Transcript_16900/g.37756  ORF Transcript_16900/g.37756 Transcript_16900/m.37756 type:complete len:296 (+) Transcript_16900:611-1498(+)
MDVTAASRSTTAQAHPPRRRSSAPRTLPTPAPTRQDSMTRSSGTATTPPTSPTSFLKYGVPTPRTSRTKMSSRLERTGATCSGLRPTNLRRGRHPTKAFPVTPGRCPTGEFPACSTRATRTPDAFSPTNTKTATGRRAPRLRPRSRPLRRTEMTPRPERTSRPESTSRPERMRGTTAAREGTARGTMARATAARSRAVLMLTGTLADTLTRTLTHTLAGTLVCTLTRRLTRTRAGSAHVTRPGTFSCMTSPCTMSSTTSPRCRASRPGTLPRMRMLDTFPCRTAPPRPTQAPQRP